MQPERYPLPFGWIKQTDPSGRSFYVDTKANPPRSIWIHPYEDAEYLKAHPDVREKLNVDGFGASGSDDPPSFEESQRRHSYPEQSSSSRPQASTSATDLGKHKDRGFFGKLKDKAIGTKEWREAEKKRRQEEDRLRMEAQRERVQQMIAARQEFYANQPQYGSQYGSQYGPQYGPGPAIVGSPYGGGYGQYGNQRRRQGGGLGGIGLPLLGGIAGGLLLGDLLDDGFGGGGFGGGDFGGGFF